MVSALASSESELDRFERSPCERSPSQASLLRRRGDLRQSRASFRARLPRPSPTALPMREGDNVSRVGMELERSPSGPTRLRVARVDQHPRRRTPVATWNSMEQRQMWRTALSRESDPEFHASLDLRPGDRIAAVDDVVGSTAMLRQLSKAMDGTSPKAVDLNISRDLTDVLKPKPADGDEVSSAGMSLYDASVLLHEQQFSFMVTQEPQASPLPSPALSDRPSSRRGSTRPSSVASSRPTSHSSSRLLLPDIDIRLGFAPPSSGGFLCRGSASRSTSMGSTPAGSTRVGRKLSEISLLSTRPSTASSPTNGSDRRF